MIDWMTLRCPLDNLPEHVQRVLRSQTDRLIKVDASSGEIVWETPVRTTVRSDTHQVSVLVGARDIEISGSPARVVGNGCNVFSSGPVAETSLVGAARLMVQFAAKSLGVALPLAPEAWRLTRADITFNLALPSLSEVRAALSVLRGVNGGRYRVEQDSGDTVYWSKRSTLRAAKAYAKGPHLRYLKRKGQRDYSEEELALADKLLRLELVLRRHFWSRLSDPWWQVGPGQLYEWWCDFFMKMVGSVEVQDSVSIEKRLEAVAASPGRAKAALGCWALIESYGWERARTMFAKATWYRHLKLLREAGLGDADISAGQVVPFRRRAIEVREVESWTQLRAA